MLRLTIDEVRAKLSEDVRHCLDDALVEQNQIAGSIAQELATAKERVELARLDLSALEARLAGRARAQSDVKLTATEVAEGVKVHPERLQAARSLVALEKEHSVWTGLSDAWRRRGYSLRNLSDLWLNDYFDSQPVSIRGPSNKEASYAAGRAAMRQAGARRRGRID